VVKHKDTERTQSHARGPVLKLTSKKPIVGLEQNLDRLTENFRTKEKKTRLQERGEDQGQDNWKRKVECLIYKATPAARQWKKNIEKSGKRYGGRVSKVMLART